MTEPNPGRRRAGATPYVLLAVLVATWVVLAATVPVTSNRNLTIDVSCASGNPPVGIWVESASGGSWWGEEGEGGSTAVKRFTFRQRFTAEYRVDVGCGGTSGNWGVSAKSANGSAAYRRLVCDDDRLAGTTAAQCRDQAAG
ncbi:hypothetical protein ACIGNX_29510 [Actinosynnema sp. NPDC053489]|uniref:hypothetical protein n=1 Tax=Actinosynnema sp. NPDC053489 TaxID=3363916 RepID=UPI0037C62EF5